MLLEHENETYSHRRIRACLCHNRRDTFTEYPIDVPRQDGIKCSNRTDTDGYFVTSIRCARTPFSSLQLKFAPLSSCNASKCWKNGTKHLTQKHIVNASLM